MNLKEVICDTSILALLIVSGYNLYLTKNLENTLADNAVVLAGKIDSVSVNTDGKLQDLTKKYDTLASVNNTVVTQKEVVYTAKESSTDADVELNTVKPQVNVKVNGGKTYKFDLLENESSKFENGKLIVTSAATSNINITASEYDRSKWSISTAVNADKKTLFGVGYSLGHSVTANVYVGNGIKPYYGITWNIGSHTKK